ncbi:hypothetical protein [Mesorhizobium sp.]|uniref:hypothetical protein n=1 Tax=Mesorhizobium sp. TaxID=1871066 RepID=UPI001200B888|nr:hypothetical protein [Mesorhizobium sp.]TIN82656.1 MAG: hypothetical protein E5X97_29285 [Mesorhizobium sp.]
MIDLPTPAIIQPLEVGPWAHAERQMARLGLSRQVRRAIEKELRRIVGAKPSILRPTLEDLARFAGEPKLATFPFPVFSPTGAAVSGPVTYRGSATLLTGGSSQTFNVGIGTAAADRLVVALLFGLRNAGAVRTISSVPIDGTNGTIHVQTGVNDGVNQGLQLGVASRLVTSGTTIDVTVNWSGILSASAILVYTVTGLASTTPTDTASATGNEASVSTLDNNANGVIIMAAGAIDGTLGPLTLTGVSNKDGDQTIVASPSTIDMRVAGGWSAALASATNRTTSVSSSGNFEALAAVSWA